MDEKSGKTMNFKKKKREIKKYISVLFLGMLDLVLFGKPENHRQNMETQ